MSVAPEQTKLTDRSRTGPTGLVLRFIDAERGRGFRAIRHRSFRNLYVGTALQQVGFWTSHLTLQGLVEDVSDGDTFAVTLLFVALFLPATLFGPFGGVLADRADRRRVMMVAYLLTGVVAAALAGLTNITSEPPLVAVYALTFGLGLSFVVLGPATSASVANSVPRSELSSAISLHSASSNLFRVIGPLLAAPLIAAGRFDAGFTIFAVACGLALLAQRRVELTPFVPDADDVGVFARVRDGLAHARSREPALRAIVTVGVTAVFGVAHVTLIPSFASEVLGRDSGEFAWLVSATGIGAVAGALFAGYGRSTPRLATAGRHQALYGSTIVLFALSGNLALAALAQVAVGFFYFTTMTMLQTLVQHVVAEAKRARVMSLFVFAWAGIAWVGALLVGTLADPLGLGVRTTILVSASVCVVHGIWVSADPRPIDGDRGC